MRRAAFFVSLMILGAFSLAVIALCSPLLAAMRPAQRRPRE